MIAKRDLGKGFGESAARAQRAHPTSADRLARGLIAPLTPARHISFDNLVRLKIAPRVLNAAARKRNHIGSIVIDTQQFHRCSFVRKSVDNEFCDPIVQRGQVLAPVASKEKQTGRVPIRQLRPRMPHSLRQVPRLRRGRRRARPAPASRRPPTARCREDRAGSPIRRRSGTAAS